MRRADGPLIAVVDVPGVEEHRQPGAGLRGARRRHEHDHRVAPGDDTAAMISCLQQLGCGIGIGVEGDDRIADVAGTGGELAPGGI